MVNFRELSEARRVRDFTHRPHQPHARRVTSKRYHEPTAPKSPPIRCVKSRTLSARCKSREGDRDDHTAARRTQEEMVCEITHPTARTEK
jgi:hypothetical protein